MDEATRAGNSSAGSTQAALESLCRAYWYPVYAFLRRRGCTHREAEDLTQEFFAEWMGAGAGAHADLERGRFRTALFTMLSHHLTDERRRARAAHRDEPAAMLALDTEGADERFAREPDDPGSTPAEAFDRHWAMSTITHAIDALRTEYARRGRAALLEALGPFVWGGSAPRPQAYVAAELGMTEHAFAVAVHRLRHRLREHLRARVATTVADPSKVDAELRFLLAVVRRRPVAA